MVTIVFLATSAPSLGAQSSPCPALSVGVKPDSPRQGAFLVVELHGVPDGAQLAGDLANEPLHFSPAKGESLAATALAGVGVDAPLAGQVRVWCRVADASDSVSLVLRLIPGAYATERLRVDPQFASTPDSALAVRIERESAKARTVARESHHTPRLWQDSFVPPRMARITSDYGRAREFNGTVTSRHLGTDFAGVAGAPVSAINRGVVRLVESFFYGGNVVYVDHGNGLTSAYLHLSQTLVARGDTVARGQVIGRVGATGRVTGPHLHLITRYGSTSLDPMSLLRTLGDSTALASLNSVIRPPSRPKASSRRRGRP